MSGPASTGPRNELGARKLFVGGLSYQTTQASLAEHFSRFGELEDTVIMKDSISRRSRGFGFVTFMNRAGAELALKETRWEIDGREVDAKLAVPRSESGGDSGDFKKSPGSSSCDLKDRSGSYSTDSQTMGRADATSFHPHKLFVGGLHYATTTSSFRVYFESFGEVEGAMVVFNRETRKSRGFGFVIFKEGKSVDLVMQNKVHVINGKQVEIKVAVPRSDSAGSYSSTNSQQQPQPQPQQQQQQQQQQKQQKKQQQQGEGSSDDKERRRRQSEDKKEDGPVKAKKPIPTTANFSYATALTGTQTASKPPKDAATETRPEADPTPPRAPNSEQKVESGEESTKTNATKQPEQEPQPQQGQQAPQQFQVNNQQDGEGKDMAQQQQLLQGSVQSMNLGVNGGNPMLGNNIGPGAYAGAGAMHQQQLFMQQMMSGRQTQQQQQQQAGIQNQQAADLNLQQLAADKAPPGVGGQVGIGSVDGSIGVGGFGSGPYAVPPPQPPLYMREGQQQGSEQQQQQQQPSPPYQQLGFHQSQELS
mmetsp:Transcript_19527/g.40463  ORF Transcript_19527/g.40463 Transcript_19527/m.40463 type:complete len:534 (+) Transcript_19527:138-1739(+)